MVFKGGNKMNNWVKGALDVLNSTLITEQLETVIKGLEENTEAILIGLKEIKKGGITIEIIQF